MKYSTWIVRVAMVMVSWATVGITAQGPANNLQTDGVARISIAELDALLASGTPIIVDVRDHEAYALFHIPGAISVPLPDLSDRAGELIGMSRPIITYCS
jgi:3-mercaptopyruvate sulfurtransferase SseA